MSDIKHILECLHQYMFLDKNYNNHFFSNTTPEKFFSSATPQKDNEIKNIFVPNKKDKLFWCFYIMKYGMDNYNLIIQNHFKIETSIKLDTAESLINYEILLKQHKLKRQEIENELVNEKKISLRGLHALCLIHNINILIIFDKAYYNMHGLSEDDPFIIEKCDDEYGILQCNKTKEKDNEKRLKKYYEIEDYRKPIKGISAYKVAEIKEIASLLDIKLVDTIGNKKTKKQIYDEIIGTFNI